MARRNSNYNTARTAAVNPLVFQSCNTRHAKQSMLNVFILTFRLPYKRRLRWHVQIDFGCHMRHFSVAVAVVVHHLFCFTLLLLYPFSSLSFHLPICIFFFWCANGWKPCPYECVCLCHSSKVYGIFFLCVPFHVWLYVWCFALHTLYFMAFQPDYTARERESERESKNHEITCYVSKFNYRPLLPLDAVKDELNTNVHSISGIKWPKFFQ